MSSTKVLKFIGKGQITIPQEWRNILGMANNAVKATMQGNKIILETLSLNDESSWEVEHIALNDLTKSDQTIILQGRDAYKKGKRDAFMNAQDFFKQ